MDNTKGVALTEHQEEIVEAIRKDPPKPKGELASFEEFQKDPKGYSMQRGLRPQGLRTHVIMPTNVQVSLRDFAYMQATHDEFHAGEKVVDILRRIDFSRNYRGRRGFKDHQRHAAATITHESQSAFDYGVNMDSSI